MMRRFLPFLLGVYLLCGGVAMWLANAQIERAETRIARDEMVKLRRVFVANGARVKGSTVEFDRTQDMRAIAKRAGFAIETRAKNFGHDWALAANQLKSAPVAAFTSGDKFAAWTKVKQGNSTVLVRLAQPQRLSTVRRNVLWLVVALGMLGLIPLIALRNRMVESDRTPSQPRNLSDELATEQRRERESEALFRQMALNASDVLYAIYPDSGRIDWFGQIDAMLGYANGSFPRTVEAWAEHIHGDEADKIIALYSASCQSHEPFNVEYRMRHRNGSYRTWQHRGRAMLDGSGNLQRIIGACSDITDRKKAEARLRASEEKLSRIVETAADAILIVAPDDTITFANPAAENVFGASRADLLKAKYEGGNWRIRRADGEELPTQQWPSRWAIASGETVYNIEHAIEQSSGRVLVVSVNAAPLRDENDEISGAVLGVTDVTGRKALEDRLTFQAFHDPLTKLPNRALLMDRLEHALIRARRSKTEVAVLFLDLDNFKKTNDTLGHDAGDELLKTTASRLLNCVRGGDTAARFAGDEFTLLLDNIVDEAGAMVVANRVLKSLLEPVEIGSETVFAPPSIGLALGTPQDSPLDVLKRADEAMYKAKKGGKAQIVVWREEERTVEIDGTPV